MDTNERVESIIKKHDYSDYKWINPSRIVVSHWVRMKCLYGCDEYGKTATCPPQVPSVSECERFFQEYSKAVVFHFVKEVKKPEDRFLFGIRKGVSAVYG
jgi:predicted metal-binding protein